MVTTARCKLLVTGFGLLVSFAPFSKAADQPTGMAACSGAFQVDGLPVSNTSTVFVGSRIDSLGGVCTIRRANGAIVKLESQSGIIITDTGVTLTHGTIQTKGNSDLGLFDGKSLIKPGAPQTAIQASFFDKQLLVNVRAGDATLVGSKSELFAHLDTGTLMRFSPVPQEPSGMYMWARGCLYSTQDTWYVNDRHVPRYIELLGETIGKSEQPVGIWGAPQELAPDASRYAARLRVVQEKAEVATCEPFVPVVVATPLQTGVAAGVAAGIGGIAGIPGQSTTSVSVP